MGRPPRAVRAPGTPWASAPPAWAVGAAWEGGLGAARRARATWRAVGAARSPDGARPAGRGQRIDASGVDGEALMVAEAADARFDASAFVQPSLENQREIEAVAAAAGMAGAIFCPGLRQHV